MTVHNFACLYDTETGCVCVSEKPFNAGNIQKAIVCAFFVRKRQAYVHVSQTRPHEHLRWSQTRIRISFSSLRRVLKSPPNISSRSCHCALWAALQSQGQVARWQKILEKK